MGKRFISKLNSSKGSSLPEALVGFLIAVLTSMILVGVVMTSGNIMSSGQEALDGVYGEQRALDIFVRHQYISLPDTVEPSFKTLADSDSDLVDTYYDRTIRPTEMILTDVGTGVPGESTYPRAKTYIAYCRSKKHKILGFTTPPSQKFR